jgi:hypothetical protein
MSKTENMTNQIDKQKVKEELEKRQLISIQSQLTKDRRRRLWLMSFLLAALLFTVIYGTIQDPFQYTFSKIGNRFSLGNRVLFITWAITTGTIIQASVLALFTIEKYKKKMEHIFLLLSVVFLVISSLSPSLPELPFWTWVHLITAGLFALFLTLGFYPFAIWVARENPRLTKTIYVWLGITWGGGSFWYISLGNTGVFEMWFFTSIIIFLLYLSLTLFEERIVKQSILLLKDETNLNWGIEKIFIDLEEREHRKRRKKNKKG